MKNLKTIQAGAMALLLSTAFAQAVVLSDFNLENAISGAPLGGPVGTARTTSSVGSALPYTSADTQANYTVSTLTHTGPGDFNAIGANVRSDTLALAASGGFSGNFVEIAPHRLTNTETGDKNPAIFGGDYLSFTIQADSGYQISLNSFSYDKGVADGAAGSGTISFQTQAWYSLDGGSTWTKMQEDQNLSHPTNDSFSSSSSFINLTGVTALQSLTGEITVALSMGDNSGRSPYSATSTNPAAFYLDNIQLAGDVSAVPEANSYALIFGILSLLSMALYRRKA